ncbi:MAG: alpha/beta hydrolase [Coleofasciculaceae cyanobacterium]
MLPTYLLKLPNDEQSNSSPKPLPCSIIFQPLEQERQKPAVIYLHGWNGYPYSLQACFLGSALASQGYLFLSLGMHRRGVEGQMRSIPEDDIEDLTRGVEYLNSHGCSEIIIVGEGIGALTALRYQCKKQDNRVKGIVLSHPLPDLTTWLENTIGEDRYQALEQKSESEVIEGAEAEKWVDLTVNNNNKELLIYQSFYSWLSWWGSNADTKISDFLRYVKTPLLLLHQGEVEFEKIEINMPGSRSCCVEDSKQLVQEIESWVSQLKLPRKGWFQVGKSDVSQSAEMVTVQTSDGRNLVGFLWGGGDSQANQTVVLHVRGKTGTPITEPLFTKLAEVYNQNQIAALVIELRRSGYGGSMQATSSMDVDDIDAFVNLLCQRGYTRIILSGQSLGSNSIMRYQVQCHHPNVVALVHMAPTQDCADWLKKHIGSDVYQSLLTQAKTAVAEGCGNQGLIGKPPYQNMLSPQRPDSWLSWWSPEADTANLKTIGKVDIPMLLLCGSQDFFNDRDRLNQLQAAATRSPVTDIIWYEGCGHNFANFERKTAEDVVSWLNKLENICQG